MSSQLLAIHDLLVAGALNIGGSWGGPICRYNLYHISIRYDIPHRLK